MKTIQLDNMHLDIPETWNEVPKAKLRKIIELVYLKGDSGTTYHELIRITVGLSKKRWEKFCNKFFGKQLVRSVREANAMVLHDVYRQLSWMYRDPLEVKPFEFFEHNGVRYYLPEPDFYSISFGELSDAYVHTQAFVKQLIIGDERLNYLVATICRPKREDGNYMERHDWNGDVRELYNEYVAKERSKVLADISSVTKHEILIYFAACLNRFFDNYDIFSDAEGSEDYPGQGLFRNQHLLAEKGIYTGLDAVKRANAHEVMVFLREHKADVDAEIAAREKKNYSPKNED